MKKFFMTSLLLIAFTSLLCAQDTTWKKNTKNSSNATMNSRSNADRNRMQHNDSSRYPGNRNVNRMNARDSSYDYTRDTLPGNRRGTDSLGRGDSLQNSNFPSNSRDSLNNRSGNNTYGNATDSTILPGNRNAGNNQAGMAGDSSSVKQKTKYTTPEGKKVKVKTKNGQTKTKNE